MKKYAPLLILTGLITGGRVIAQVDRPIVQMSVTLPDGKVKTLSAPAYEVTTTAVRDGAEYGFAPRVIDSKPWTHVVVAIFKMSSQGHYTKEIGDVDLRLGGPAAASKTTPIFKVAVTKVTPPANFRLD